MQVWLVELENIDTSVDVQIVALTEEKAIEGAKACCPEAERWRMVREQDGCRLTASWMSPARSLFPATPCSDTYRIRAVEVYEEKLSKVKE